MNETKEDLLIHTLREFYSDPHHFRVFSDLVLGKHVVSLRVVDWFVTNYSRVHSVRYIVPGDDFFCVHQSYKNHLKGYYKKYFDPFRRRDRLYLCKTGAGTGAGIVSVPIDRAEILETTVGQLNFFRWVIMYQVLDYIVDNLATIECEMNEWNAVDSKRISCKTFAGPVKIGFA